MKTSLIASLLIATFVLSAQDAARPKTPAPADLLDKTFEQCNALLGKPDRSDEPDGRRRSYDNSYQPSIPGVAQIKLRRLPVGSMNGKVSETVNAVWYYFPKGRVKTVGECFTLIGVDLAGASHSSAPFKDVAATDPLDDAKGMSFDIAGGLAAYWEPAARSLKNSVELQHADADVISFQKRRGPSMKERHEQEKKAKAP